MASPICFNKTMAASSSNSIAHTQSPGTSKLTLTSATVTIDTASSTNQAIGRRVLITSGSDDSGIKWIVVGTNNSGNTITDIFPGANGAATSNLDFVTVSSITPTGAGAAGTVIAGTSGVGSSPWQMVNWHVTQPINIGFGVELVTGSANFTVQHTFDDPNNVQNLTVFGLAAGQTFSPLAFNNAVVNAASATIEGAYTQPISAYRLLINSGTGQLRFRAIQAGIG